MSKIQRKILAGFLAMLVPYAVFGVVLSVNLKAVNKSIYELQAIYGVMNSASSLQIALDRVLMPGNDYIITGDRGFYDAFRVESSVLEEALRDLDRNLKKAEELIPDKKFDEEKKIFTEVSEGALKIREVSLKIFAIDKPANDPIAAELMKEMDYKWAYPTIDRLNRFREIGNLEYARVARAADDSWNRSLTVAAVSFLLLLVAGAAFAFLYARSFVRSLRAIEQGAISVAGGQFNSKVELHTNDEIEELGKTFNHMVDEVRSCFGTLEKKISDRTEQAKRSDTRYRHLFNSLIDAAFVADVETGLIIDVNKQGEALLGRARGEIIGMHQSELHPEGKRAEYRKLFAEHSKKESASDLDLEMLRKNGEVVHVSVSGATLELDGHRVILGIFRDINSGESEGKALMERAGELERLRKASKEQETTILGLKEKIRELEGKLGGEKAV